jgi:hypothetical protein
MSREEALGTLARRYFRSHGPATLRDFAWWSGLPMRDVRAAVGDANVDVLLTPPTLERVDDATFLLPNYDEYVIAYRDRGAIIRPDRTRNLGVFTSREFPHQVIIDGQVGGSWRRGLEGGRLVIDVAPYQRLSKRHRAAIHLQAERCGRVLGLPSEVRFK